MNEVNALTNMVETKTLEQLVFEIRISGDHSMYGPWEGFDWMQSSKTALTDIEWMQMHSEDAEHGNESNSDCGVDLDVHHQKRELSRAKGQWNSQHGTLLDRLRKEITENLELALLSPSAYIRSWAEWVADEKS